MDDNTLVDIVTLKIELENVSKELVNIRDQIVELNQKQSENIEQNNRDIHNLYDRLSDLNTKLELIKQRLESAEHHVKDLHTSNRKLIVNHEILQAKLDEMNDKLKEDHLAIENIRAIREHAYRSGDKSRTHFVYSIISGVIVAVVMLLINMMM